MCSADKWKDVDLLYEVDGSRKTVRATIVSFSPSGVEVRTHGNNSRVTIGPYQIVQIHGGILGGMRLFTYEDQQQFESLCREGSSA